MTATDTGAAVPQQMTAAERTRLESLHGQLCHEVNQHEAAGDTAAAQLARARAFTIACRLGWSA